MRFAIAFLIALAASAAAIGAPSAAPAVGSTPAPTDTPSKEETVVLNSKSLVYHCRTCKWALKCTKNCVTVTRSEAKRRGGKPCKDCGGDCD